MRREKALIMALKIVDTCRKYGNEDRCLDCPFNVHGCIVTDGNNIPTDWRSSELIKSIEIQDGKRGIKHDNNTRISTWPINNTSDNPRTL